HFFLVFKLKGNSNLVARYGIEPNVPSKNAYSALLIAIGSLRISLFKNPMRTSFLISLSCTSIVTQRIPFRRRSRCRRMRSAAAEWAVGSAEGGLAIISSSCAMAYVLCCQLPAHAHPFRPQGGTAPWGYRGKTGLA